MPTQAEVRLYDTLFAQAKPDDAEDFRTALNPQSLTVLSGCRVEPALAAAAPGALIQFERTGYFCVDTRDSAPGGPSSTAPWGSATPGARSKRRQANADYS